MNESIQQGLEEDYERNTLVIKWQLLQIDIKLTGDLDRVDPTERGHILVL